MPVIACFLVFSWKDKSPASFFLVSDGTLLTEAGFFPCTQVTHSCLPGEQRAKAKVLIALHFSQKLEETGKCTKTPSTSVDGLAQATFAIGAMPPKITAGIAPLSLEEPCREKPPWIILLIA